MNYYNNNVRVRELLNKVDDNTRVKITKILFNRFSTKDIDIHSDNMLDYITVSEVKMLESKISGK